MPYSKDGALHNLNDLFQCAEHYAKIIVLEKTNAAAAPLITQKIINPQGQEFIVIMLPGKIHLEITNGVKTT
ncbi:MAG: hypothetical protein CV087_10415 [Candidatus Brocadia sp. WS118]|nr:MAG: hypothetical protein CV087_10415 [Candidatus Brocadia sp. WS118]